ncbi:MAG TPA: ImcF-related family protein [Gemmatimonadales bacterium]|nr:ImcF-related family protein [Gemmatimonadales bacterium]
MKARLKVWLVGTIALLIWVLVVWLVINFLGLSGREYKLVATFLITLGVSAICAVIWYFLNQQKAKEGPKEGPVDEIDKDISAARNRLAAAKLSDKTRLSQLPLILCLGPTDSAKTSILIRSGLDPDLLTGEVQRGDAVVATRGVNLWYSNKTILMEAGGRLVADSGRFSRLIRYIQPSRTSAVLTSGRQAPRVAIVTLSIEDLLRPGGGEQVATHARELRQRLLETSKKLGIRLPVYVVFTKADKIPYFAEFVRNFSSDEAKEVLGATLPWDSGPAGTYADRTASRIGSAMQRLAASLASHRLQFLPRETQPALIYGSYEFAREFRKLVPQATQFLVDLCKPSQLEVSPVLRGFYFTGVRAVVVEESGGMAPQPQQRQAQLAMDATQAFVPSMYGVQQAPAGPVGPVSRKIPQWMFLGRFFKDVIFKDRVALAATAGGARVNLLRRVVLATAAGLAVFYTLMLIISFAGNRRLKNRVEAAIRNVSADALPAGDLATVETLRRLDTLRMVNEQLGTWNREGAPIGYRWGLYSGNSLFRQSNRVYFARFDSLMYSATFNRILENMRNFPVTRTDSTDYEWTYNQLKAHLITTDYPEKSTPEFLEPVLLDAWKQGHEIPSDEKIRLARAQFAYFAGELARGNNMLPSPPDSLLMRKSRELLRQFKDGEQIYQIMQTEAGKAGAKPFDFDRTFGNQVLSAPHVVPAAFTRKGWTYMWGSAFKNPDQYFQGEEWVLGQEKLSENQRYEVVNKIKAKYRDEYARHWRQLLADARIAQFGSLQDAARKVKLLGSNPSPLMQLINAVSLNTSVDSIFAATTFQPALTVSPADSARLISDASAPYVKAVQSLATALDAVASAAPADRAGPAEQAKNAVTEAKNAASSLGIAFATGPNSVGPDITRLLNSGFSSIDGMLGGVGVAGINKAGADFCGTFGKVLTKSPVSPNGPAASIDEVTAFFGRPDGALWNLYNTQLARLLSRTGSSYAPTPGSSVRVNPRFVQFFSRAAQFSRALYPEGADQVPRMGFSFRAIINSDVTLVKLVVDGNNRTYSATRTGDQPFTWIGETAQETRLEATIRGNTQTRIKSGTWSLFQLFADARNWRQNGLKYTAEWSFQHEAQTIPVQFELTLPDAAPILNPEWLRGMSCVSAIAGQ